jgi:23S rRNA (pseudouridine1915-N3)-methyltransferase
LLEEYSGRLAWPLTLREVDVKRRVDGAELRRLEGELLLAAVPPGAVVVVLDERGRTLDSPGFARQIGQWRDSGRAELAFLIGGADGHCDSVRQRADLLLSLGAMTWPHMLVRGLLAEQLYRAAQILAGHPYHRV